jgi:ribosomal protein S18 acetylase RimI-like enzyme
MVVRVARVEDAPGMARVMVDTFLSAHRGQMPEEAWRKRREEWTYEVSENSWARKLREIEDDRPQECIYVALDDAGDVAGLAVGGPPRADGPEDTGEIHMLYVRESHQRRGLGRLLVQAVAAHLAQMGRHQLLIGCLAANAPARRFYEALGGRLVGEREYDEDGVMLPEVVYGWPDTQALAAEGTAEPSEGREGTLSIPSIRSETTE